MMILGWIEDYPILELLVVMVIVPVIMNGLAYWVQDNFLMKRDKEAEEKNLIEENLKDNARMND
jgi:Tfp pilus assembly protein PilO